MTVMEPVGLPGEPATAVLPAEEPLVEVREVAAPAAVVERDVDHVRRHARDCYWDLRMARWECSRG
jgi:hypothetical protein